VTALFFVGKTGTVYIERGRVKFLLFLFLCLTSKSLLIFKNIRIKSRQFCLAKSTLSGTIIYHLKKSKKNLKNLTQNVDN